MNVIGLPFELYLFILPLTCLILLILSINKLYSFLFEATVAIDISRFIIENFPYNFVEIFLLPYFETRQMRSPVAEERFSYKRDGTQ